jgi:hypothetical protein
MKILANVLVLFLLLLTPSGCALADTSISKQSRIKSYDKIIMNADVIHFDGSVIVEKSSGYQVKCNSTSLTSLQGGKNTYIDKSLVGGINKSDSAKHIITFIPLYKLRDINDPAKRIGLVSVNKKPAKYILFLPGKDFNRVIKIAKEKFKSSELFMTQLHPKTPVLFIDAGVVQPNDSVRIDYEVKH